MATDYITRSRDLALAGDQRGRLESPLLSRATGLGGAYRKLVNLFAADVCDEQRAGVAGALGKQIGVGANADSGTCPGLSRMKGISLLSYANDSHEPALLSWGLGHKQVM
ncbi:hypothetical protein NDU88_002701 [Pleurodeles waltl]|uniref:Uncharacterized protein n=1 Tax=Pleurodeles waltl TaxID=8319 RepID=A0AAV7SDZ7_PLEWA|nr:hypothetical protein NDU88_002701 [Pleurodeles waltl]